MNSTLNDIISDLYEFGTDPGVFLGEPAWRCTRNTMWRVEHLTITTQDRPDVDKITWRFGHTSSCLPKPFMGIEFRYKEHEGERELTELVTSIDEVRGRSYHIRQVRETGRIQWLDSPLRSIWEDLPHSERQQPMYDGTVPLDAFLALLWSRPAVIRRNPVRVANPGLMPARRS